jgi:hypothetical protein
MSYRDDFAADRYRLISALLTLHEEAPELDESGVGRRAVWSAGTLAECAIESETHYALDRAGTRYDPRVAAVCLGLFRAKGYRLTA